jgi:hypothetical protein
VAMRPAATAATIIWRNMVILRFVGSAGSCRPYVRWAVKLNRTRRIWAVRRA